MVKKKKSKLNKEIKRFDLKKAQSQIITTILIILVALTAIVIVWNVIYNLLTRSSEQVDINPFLFNGELEYSLVNLNTMGVSVKRGSGGGDISGIKIIIQTDLGSYYFDDDGSIKSDLPEELEVYNTNLSASDFKNSNENTLSDFSLVTKMSLYYIYSGGKLTRELDSKLLIPEETICTPAGIEICDNNFDEDCDGDVDCGDDECVSDNYCIYNNLINSNNLISWWEFNGNYEDSKGVNDETAYGGAQIVNDELVLDGANDYVINSSTLSSFLILNNIGTISAWIKRGYLSSTSTEIIAFRGTSISAYSNISYILYFSEGHPIIYISNGATMNRAEAESVTLDTNWHHLLGLWNGTKLVLYVDGIQRGIATQTINANQNQGFPLVIGTSNKLVNFFNGSIDEIMIFDRALSTNEINSIYQEQIK